MTRFILWTVGGVAVLSAAYLGFVKLVFSPSPDTVVLAADPPAAAEPMLIAEPSAPPALPAAAVQAPPRAPRPAPSAALQPPADSASADTAAVRRLTVELAERTRRVAHVGKPVARHVARDVLGLGDDGCLVTDGVRLCLVPSPVGGWQVIGAQHGYAIAARGPAALGDAVAVSVVDTSD